MIYKRFKMPVMILAAFVLTGCQAMMLNDDMQKIKFLTPDVQNAVCRVTVAGYEYDIAPPQTLWLERRDDPLDVACQHDGYKDARLKVLSYAAPQKYKQTLNKVIPGNQYDISPDGKPLYPDVVFVKMEQKPDRPDVYQVGPKVPAVPVGPVSQQALPWSRYPERK